MSDVPDCCQAFHWDSMWQYHQGHYTGPVPPQPSQNHQQWNFPPADGLHHAPQATPWTQQRAHYTPTNNHVPQNYQVDERGLRVSPRRRHSIASAEDYNQYAQPPPNFFPDAPQPGSQHFRSLPGTPPRLDSTEVRQAPEESDHPAQTKPSQLEETASDANGKVNKASSKKRTKKADKDDQEKPPKKPKKPRGQGAKSGVNRREPGASDDDVAGLSKKEAKSVTKNTATTWSESDTLTVVKYIVEPKRWEKFKAQQAHDFQTISQKILGGRKDVDQVRNLWHKVWDKYKTCRRREKHTGGGDGDVDDTGAGSGEEDGDDEEREGEEESPVPAAEVDAETGEKPKELGDGQVEGSAGDGGDKPRTKKKARYSKAVLDRFEQSEVYRLIDEVAHNNTEVVRTRVYNGASATSDDENGKPRRLKSARSSSPAASSDEAFMKQILATMQARHKATDARETRRLELEERAEKRAAEELEERRKREKREHRAGMWDRAIKLSSSANAKVAAQGEKMLARLAEEEEQDGFE
ncbi:hypothetical protein GLOTRDRAFT_93846 [Gloeophyllum trabeum ATCC 11539]|uniref:Uncharacterized protein n=1 Tax=Gloeophyllum trabeum (strain ATCC 11539 / FP-39264 / Madison 617) TaxID=670483 RepID=S7RRC7_GLOTA|nr:uncharacterized protein GLOTRDRAFT_93846 [Gloeophyllum trabeum ATCC 11539]EPQ55479.1 hypothetical protein GLOTRDRAFT_93846 [Gloeophyllum trabeum ATCC 11539]